MRITSTHRRLAAGAAAAITVAGAIIATGPAASAVTPACSASAIGVAATATQGAAGHGSLVVQFHNHGASTCTLQGYPGLDALNASLHLLAHASRTLSGMAGGAHSTAAVTLKRDGWASATVEWDNFNTKTGGTCTFSHAIATTPPNTSATVRFSRAVSVCGLQVHPVVAGTSGRG